MNKLKLFLLAALALLGTNALAQNPLSEATAHGNRVYFEIINDAEHPIPEDEVEDVTRELINAGSWKQVSEPEDADFIMQVMAKKRVVFNSPRTRLTPSGERAPRPSHTKTASCLRSRLHDPKRVAERTRVNAHISPHIAKPRVSCRSHSNN